MSEAAEERLCSADWRMSEKLMTRGKPRCPHITLPAGAVVKSSAYVDLPTTDAHDVPARAVISVDMRASDGASLSDCGGLHGGSGLRHGY